MPDAHARPRGVAIRPTPAPLLPAALGFLAGIAAAEGCGPLPLSLAIVLALAPAAAVWLLLGRAGEYDGARRGLLFAAAACAGAARHHVATLLPADHVAHVASAGPLLTRVVGRVVTPVATSPPAKHNEFLPFDPPARTRFVIEAHALGVSEPPPRVRGLVRVTVRGEGVAARPGDRVQVTGRLFAPRGPQNPGETDWRRWHALQGIHAGISAEGPHYVQVVSRGDGPAAWFDRLRSAARAAMLDPLGSDLPPDAIPLLDAMVLGQRSATTRALDEAFVRTGTVHLLSVSGFHVAALAGGAWWLAGLVRLGGRAGQALFTILVILLYVAIAEPNAPIVRSAIMGVLACTAVLLRRGFCGLNWLSASALVVLALNPLEAFRAGFQLSFLQVLALLLVVPPVYRALTRQPSDPAAPRDAHTLEGILVRKAWRAGAGLLVVSVVAWAAAIPLVALHFGLLTPWGPIQSALISPLATLVVFAGFASAALGALHASLAWPAGVVLGASTQLLLSAVHGLAKLPATSIQVPDVSTLLALLTYLPVFVWAWTRRRLAKAAFPTRRAVLRMGALASAAPAIGGWLVWATPPAPSAGAAVLALAVGNGSATLVTLPTREALLVDAGTSANVDAGASVLSAMRVEYARRLHALAVSHANLDHYSGVPTVLHGAAVERLWLSEYFDSHMPREMGRRFYERIGARLPEVETLTAGERRAVGQAELDVLWPPRGLPPDASANDASMVLRLTIFGRRVLLPGDAERDALRGLLADHYADRCDLRCDVLVAPHHGAVIAETAAFVRAAAPQVVVVSSATARPEFADLILREFGPACRLLSTADAGAVRVWISPGGVLRVSTPFAAGVPQGARQE